MSGFKRKGAGSFKLPQGSRRSAYGQLLISSGLPDFDTILGGGLASGTLNCIIEDEFSSYSNLLLHYFISEGIASSHSNHFYDFSDPFVSSNTHILKKLPYHSHYEEEKKAAELEAAKEAKLKSQIASTNPSSNSGNNVPSRGPKLAVGTFDRSTLDVPKVKLTKRAPRAPKKAASSNSAEQKPSDDLRIAWRYSHLSSNKSGVGLAKERKPSTVSAHSFDLSRVLQSDLTSKVSIYLPSSFSSYDDLLSSIKSAIIPSTIVRLAICGLGVQSTFAHKPRQLLRFLIQLRTFVKSSNVCLLFSFPAHTYSPSTASKVYSLVDSVFRFESFIDAQDAKVGTAFNDYHGQFHIFKLPSLSSFAPLGSLSLTTLTYVFKVKRRKLLLEILSLPPELGETTNNNNKSKSKSKKDKKKVTSKDLDF